MKAIMGAAILSAAILAASGAQAARMLAPVSVQVVSGGTAGSFWTVDNIIDQSGLEKTYVPGVTDLEEYMASDPRHGDSLNTRWLSQSNTTSAVLMFDFGEVVTLGKFALWDDLSTTVSRFSFSTPEFTDFASFRPVDARGSSRPPAQIFDFRDFSTRYLTVQIDGCNQGGTNWAGCGVHEMAFAEGVAGAVPEPATWAMMILGFGAAGSILRRRRNAAALT
ncbi:MAG: PEPxxWA-CTERM sorting domain-containing protein [Pseudomonadota bacterium]